MTTKTIVTDLSHDDLVNLISCATSGSSWLGVDYNRREWNELNEIVKTKDPCFEDKVADLLLANKSIVLYDMYAEDENDFFGNLPHYYDENGYMCYTITLQDILSGLEKAGSIQNGWVHKCLDAFALDDGYNLDLSSADCLIQYIMFGDYIYG